MITVSIISGKKFLKSKKDHYLVLDQQCIKPESSRNLFILLKDAPHITHLVLKNTTLDNEAAEELAKSIKR